MSMIEGRQRLCLLGLPLALMVLTAVLLLAPSRALGLEYGDFLTEFGDEGSGAGQLEIPAYPGADPLTGHILIPGPENNNRVDEFTPWGDFVKAFGWDVAPGAVNEQQELRIRADVGSYRLAFDGDETSDIASDATAEEIENALNGLTSISAGGGSVSVTDRPGVAGTSTPWVYVIAFDGGTLQGSDVPQLEVNPGTVPLSGGIPSTSSLVRTRANGAAAGVGLEACTAESGCKAGVIGPAPGQFNRPESIAIDAGGAIYVRESANNGNSRVQKFTTAGEFVLMYGGEVNKTAVQEREAQEANSEPVTITPAEENVCTAASGDVCGAGVPGTGAGEFTGGSQIAIGSEGNFFVSDSERIQIHDEDGAYIDEIAVPGKVARTFAIDPVSGDLYVIYLEVGTNALLADLHRIDPATEQEVATLEVERPIVVITNDEGHVFVVDRELEGGVEPHPERIFEFDPSGQVVSTLNFPSEDLRVRGITANGVDDVIVTEGTDNVGTAVQIFGPPPVFFESAPKQAPVIVSQYASIVEATSADLAAEINPKFWADTTYYVEYGTAPCWQGGCLTQPLPPGPELTDAVTDSPVTTDPIELSDLQSSTTYHFRFVAQSSGGGPVFGLTGETGPDAEATFTTRLGVAEESPDDRAHELVSPALKNSAEVGAPINAAGGRVIRQAAPSGEALTFASFTAFADPESAPSNSQYLSRRTAAGWTTDSISPPGFLDLYSAGPYQGFSEDLSFGGVVSFEPPLTKDAQQGFTTLYRRDNTNGALTAINTEVPKLATGEVFCIIYAGGTVDGSKVIFATNGSFVGAPKAKGVNLYEWTEAGGVELASVFDNGVEATPQRNTGFGAGGGGIGGGAGCQMAPSNLANVISDDGSKVFWSYITTTERKLFARLDGTDTVQLDAVQGGAGPSGGGEFLAASADGSKVLFRSPNALTSDSSGASDLYLYDFEGSSGQELTNLTPDALTPGGEGAEVLGLLGASEDGAYAYFAADGDLAPGAAADGCANTGGPACLYAWHLGDQVRFLGAGTNSSVWASSTSDHSSYATPDGKHLTFVTAAPLTDYDNNVQNSSGCSVNESGEMQGANPRCLEVYLYDFVSNSLNCASCNPTGARPTGPSSLPGWSTRFDAPRVLSDDGSRLFFQTYDQIDSKDQNDNQDVYEFERPGAGTCSPSNATFSREQNGCFFLVSGGRSNDASYLIDGSATGRDVFFATRERLVAEDQDERYDIYDYREGGGFPPPSPPPSACVGEDCRGGAQAPPVAPAPATPNVTGSGNSVTKPCPKGKVRRKGRCVKKPCPKGKVRRKGSCVNKNNQKRSNRSREGKRRNR